MTSCVKNLKRPSSKAQALAYLAKDLGVTIVPGPQTKARVEKKAPPTEWQRYVSQASAQLKAQGRSGSDFTEVNRLAHQIAAENGWVKGAKAPKSRPSDAAEAAARKLRGKTARQALATARATDTVLKKAHVDYIGRPATSKDSRRAPAKKKPARAAFYEPPAPTYFDIGSGPPRPATARQAKRGRSAASLGSGVGGLGRVDKMAKAGSVMADEYLRDILGYD